MARLNLKKMSFNELVVLRDRVQAELSRKIDAERGALQKQIDALAKLEAGGSRTMNGTGAAKVRRVRGSVAKTSKAPNAKKLAPKYRGPDGETWSGRGLAPRWLTTLEAGGKKRESYLIKK